MEKSSLVVVLHDEEFSFHTASCLRTFLLGGGELLFTARIQSRSACISNTLCILELIICTAIAFGLTSQSLQAEEPYDTPVPFIPETFVAPIKNSGGSAKSLGWVLIYRNQLTMPKSSIRDVQSQTVRVGGVSGNPIEGTISWRIQHSENSSCNDLEGGPCPDSIQVLSVPEGFIAVPDSALVSESEKLLIYIVRAEIG